MEAYQEHDVATLVSIFEDEDARSIEQMIAEDTNYEEALIESVGEMDAKGNISITKNDGWSIMTKSPNKKIPLVGSVIKCYGGLGRPVYGIIIDGKVWKYETPFEQFVTRLQMLAGFDREHRERVDRVSSQINTWMDELNDGPLKSGLEELKAKKPTFALDGGDYDVFIRLMAQRIYEWCKETGYTVDEFKSKDHDDQAPILFGQEGDKYGISGFQFECAVGMARALLDGTIE